MNRRNFLATSGLLAGSALVGNASEEPTKSMTSKLRNGRKWRLAMVGTGSRGTSMWGSDVVKNYSDYVEFVGLCDSNVGRVELAKKIIGVDCPVFTDFEKMASQTKPDALIITSVDATHVDYIVRALELGIYPISEKPMATDEKQIQRILDAEKKSNGNCRVTFNLRYSAIHAKIWQLLRENAIGKLTSVDFHWYLDTSHGADYFRRWHRLVEKSGSLWVHKSTHHFDILNWWIDSDPVEVYAMGGREHYGSNGQYRATNCRTCNFTDKCKFYTNIMNNKKMMEMYVDNEKYDGYLRDACPFSNDVNIDDTMVASIKYANGVRVAYSLTTYSPYEGLKVSFNGTGGKIDIWLQSSLVDNDRNYNEIILTNIFGKRQYIPIVEGVSGHGGADGPLKDMIFIPGIEDPYQQCAGSRDGSLSCLVGIAARKSATEGGIVKIANLTSIVPQVKKVYKRV